MISSTGDFVHYQYTAMIKSVIVFDQLAVAWGVKTVAVY